MSGANAATALVALAAGAAAVAFTWQPGLSSLYDDSVFYLMMAQALSPFGEASAAVREAAPFDTYPPFLSLVVALGGGAFDWRIAHAIVAVAFGASVFLLGRLARSVTDSPAMGLACALVYACMPGVWLNVKGILSEFPFMALAFGALLVHRGAREEPFGWHRALALALLLAAALLTRTIGIALVAGIAVHEAARWLRARDTRRLARVACALALPIAAETLWLLLRPSGGQDAYAEYGARMAHGAANQGFGWVAEIVRGNASAIVDAWLNALLIFWGDWWRPGFLLAIALGAAGIAAVAWRALRWEADALYCVAFVAILIAWPFPGQMFRLVLPIVPLVMMHALWSWQRVALRIMPETGARRAPWGAILPLALCVPAVAFYITGRARAPDDSPAPWRRADIAEFYRVPSGPAAAANAAAQVAVFRDLERIGATTPPEARVLWYAPAYVALLAGRRGVRLERPADTAGLAAQARAARATHVYLASLHPRDSARRLGHPLDPAAFAARLGPLVWRRDGPGGELQAALFAIDPARLTPSQP